MTRLVVIIEKVSCLYDRVPAGTYSSVIGCALELQLNASPAEVTPLLTTELSHPITLQAESGLSELF